MHCRPTCGQSWKLFCSFSTKSWQLLWKVYWYKSLRGESSNNTFDYFCFIFCLFIHDYRLKIKLVKSGFWNTFLLSPPAQTSAGGDKPATADGEVSESGGRCMGSVELRLWPEQGACSDQPAECRIPHHLTSNNKCLISKQFSVTVSCKFEGFRHKLWVVKVLLLKGAISLLSVTKFNSQKNSRKK